MRRAGLSLCCLLLLVACETPSWMGGPPAPIKRAPGERIDVVLNPSNLKPDSSVADVSVDIPEQANLTEWPNHNTAMLTPHIGLTGIKRHADATIGEGYDFSRSTIASPIVAQGVVIAMDGAGIVSAHDEGNIEKVKWTNKAGLPKHVDDVQGGGLAFDQGIIYATTGYGGLRAIEAATGNLKWKTQVGAPVRGAPAIGSGMVVVLTADNQTLAFDAETGGPRWEHRGIRESAGYYSTTSPVISDGIVVAAYSSGEVFAIRAETGSVMWTDTLGTTVKTRAAAVFTGIDADPIVQDGVVVVTSASGEMQASALLNGRPLWQKRVGSHSTPWSAGNALFVLSDTHDIAAMFKRDGGIRWATSLATADPHNPDRDTTPALYGPILAGNAIFVLDHDGNLSAFKPETGAALGTYELKGDVVTAPIVANGALYYITRDARLHKYY